MFQAPGQNGPFPTNVSAYFRRPSKVTKSSSRNNSPRNTGRRRMTTASHYPTRTRSVVDYQRASMPQLSQHQPTSSRPISWHPNMMDTSYLQVVPQYTNDSNLASPYTTIEMNGLVTPMSFPVMDEPQIQELISPLEDLSANDPSSTYAYGQDFSMETWLNQQQMKNLPNFGANMYPDFAYSTWYNFDQYGNPTTIPTAPASPNYMPMSQFDAPLVDTSEQVEPVKDELVGMGLYDSPADVQTSSLLIGNGLGSFTRKSLKLEDAFEPSPASDDEYDEDDDAPGEPDDMIPAAAQTKVANPTTENNMSAVDMSYSLQDELDFMKLRQWTASQGGGDSGWI